MSDYDNGYARAAYAYDHAEPDWTDDPDEEGLTLPEVPDEIEDRPRPPLTYSPFPWTAEDDGEALWVHASDGNTVVEYANTEGDMYLIAAAPDLRDALRALLRMAEAWQTDFDLTNPESPDYDPDYQPAFNDETLAARAALAKAEGRS